MKRNLSNIDRIARVMLAAIFAYLYFSGIVTGAFGIVLLVLAAILIIRSLLMLRYGRSGGTILKI